MFGKYGHKFSIDWLIVCLMWQRRTPNGDSVYPPVSNNKKKTSMWNEFYHCKEMTF